jgi:hypothetical protein
MDEWLRIGANIASILTSISVRSILPELRAQSAIAW